MHAVIPKLEFDMNRGSRTGFWLQWLVGLLSGFWLMTGTRAEDAAPAAGQARLIENYGKLPMSFEENRGQADPAVRFLARGPGYSLFLTPTETMLTLTARDIPASTKPTDPQRPRHAKKPAKTRSTALRMTLAGGAPPSAITGREPLPGVTNYFRGKDPAQWRTGIPTFGQVEQHEVYPGIDLVFHGNPRQLEYDFIVAPGADPKAIRLRFEAAGAKFRKAKQPMPRITTEGDLVVPTALGDVRMQKPTVYQDLGGQRRTIDGRFVLHSTRTGKKAHSPNRTEIGFRIAAYDASLPLVIDPVLVYSTYLGGSNSESAQGIAIDDKNNVYLVGDTVSMDFPATSGAFDTSHNPYSENGTTDAFVLKLNSSGTSIAYSTFLGGNYQGSNAGALDVAVDVEGSAYVVGSTQAGDFPTTPGAFDREYGPNSRIEYNDGFVTKLNSTGSALVYSTFLGGNRGEGLNGIAVDNSGNAYVAGSTDSESFPTTPGAFDTTPRGYGQTDVVLTKINPAGTSLVYSTRVGGDNTEYGNDIAVDQFGNAYVAGYALSSDFPTTPGAFDTTHSGYDSFVIKVNAHGTALEFSTFLDNTSLTDISIDYNGNSYLLGTTSTDNFETTVGAYDRTFNSNGQYTKDITITKLNAMGNRLIYSTYLGGSSTEDGEDIAIDGQGNSYITGNTCSDEFPTVAPFQAAHAGSCDGFITKLNITGSQLIYSSYLGGSIGFPGQSAFDVGKALAVDSTGGVYVTGNTASADFPTTPGAFGTTFNGNLDAFVTKISGEGNLDEVTQLRVTVPGTQQRATVPFPVTLTALDAQGAPVDMSGTVMLYTNAGERSVNPLSVPLAGGQWSGQVALETSAIGKNIELRASLGVVSGASTPFELLPATGATQPGTLLVKVTSDRKGANNEYLPLPGATVYLDANLDGTPEHQYTSDARGFVLIESLDPQEYRVWATYPQSGADKPSEKVEVWVEANSCRAPKQLTIPLYGQGKIPILLVPGIMGSHESAVGKLSNIPTLPRSCTAFCANLKLHDPKIPSLGYHPGWQDLKDELTSPSRCGDKYPVIDVPWDWRISFTQASDVYLKKAIKDAISNYNALQVRIVAHSAGGLVARHFIQNDEEGNWQKVQRLALVGTPNLGAVNAYYLWEGGDPKLADDYNEELPNRDVLINQYWWTTYHLYDNYGFGKLDDGSHDEIHEFYHTKVPFVLLKDLLPTFSFLGSPPLRPISKSAESKEYKNYNNNLADLNTNDRRKERMSASDQIGKVLTWVFWGTEIDTIASHDASGIDSKRDLYPDGVPKGWLTKPGRASGDGTVLESSAKWPADDGWAHYGGFKASKHSKLISSFAKELADFITKDIPGCAPAGAIAPAQNSIASAEIPELEVSIQGSPQPYLRNPAGLASGVNPVSGMVENSLPESDITLNSDVGLVTVNNPIAGAYQLELGGAIAGEFRVHAGYGDATRGGTIEGRYFHHGGVTTLNLLLDPAANEPLTLLGAPPAPAGLQTNAVDNSGLKTRLSWLPVNSAASYRIYTRLVTEPRLSLLASVGQTTYDTGHPWADQPDEAGLRVYAVAAVSAGDVESFLSEYAQNDDRDHDGLSDYVEAGLGSNPNLADTDGDGLTDSEERSLGTFLSLGDTDGDGFSDYQEVRANSDPLDAASIPMHALTVTNSGNGAVSSNPAGIACGVVCTAKFTEGSTVTLSATAGAGSAFSGWGGACAGLGNCQVLMGQDQSVTANFNPTGTLTGLYSAVLPYARSVQVGQPATGFGTLINATGVDVTHCYVALPVNPSIAANFNFQTTNASNQLIGTPDTPVDIPAGGAQSFVFGITPSAAFTATDIPLVFDCANTQPAPSQVGLNTFLLSASSSPVPDMIAIGATQSGDGVLRIPGSNGIHAFGTAAVNIGASGSITATADTGGVTLPITLTVCQTNPVTGVCLSAPTASVTSTVNGNESATYTVFAQASGAIPFDPAGKRIFLRLSSGGVVRGATSVALTTQ